MISSLIAAIATRLGLSTFAIRFIEFALAIVIIGAAGGYIVHLGEQAAAYKVLAAEVKGLEQKYGCGARNVAERELAACLTARQADADKAKAAELARERQAAAAEQAELDRQAAAAAQAQSETQAFIAAEAPTADGAVPQLLRDYWARVRKERGLK